MTFVYYVKYKSTGTFLGVMGFSSTSLRIKLFTYSLTPYLLLHLFLNAYCQSFLKLNYNHSFPSRLLGFSYDCQFRQ